MNQPNIVERLRCAGTLDTALAELLGVESVRAGSSIRCVYPDRHNNGDANPSLVIAKDGASAQCMACGFGGGLLDIVMDRWNISNRADAAKELERRYFGAELPPQPKRRTHKPHTDEYDYVDESGTLLFQVLRFKTTEPDGRIGKTFRQRRPDSARPDTWSGSLGETKRVLFRLPAIRKAVESRKTIFIAEGEKDVLALEKAGAVATCNPGGANKWQPEYTESLRGAALIVVVADTDVPGRRHARKVADALRSVVEAVRVVEPKEGKDSSDHLAAGHTVDDFVEQNSDALPATDDKWDGPIEIDITPDVGEIVDRADEALRRSPNELYQRAGSIVRVQRERTPKHLLRPPTAPHVALLPADALFEALASIANWKTQVGSKRVPPPKWAVKVLLARGHWTFPWLEGITETPTIRWDGSIVDQPGYDERTGLLYEPRREFPPVPRDPDAAAIREALRVLREPFAEFPWPTPADEAAAIAALFTLVMRHTVVGPTPLFAMVAPTPGSGKGLLVQAITTLATGQQARLMSAQHSDEELGKILTALASEGHRAVLFDNAEGRFGSAVLAGALTATEWTGRILGLSKTITAPLNPTWFVTGNNLTFVGDMGRRVVPVRIDPRCEHPEDRPFHRKDLLAFIREHQPRLLVAGLTLMRAFILAGRPQHGGSRMGSFEAWDDTVRSAVIWLLDEDPCGARSELREHVDLDREILSAVLCAWYQTYPDGRAVSAVEVIQEVTRHHHSALHEALTLLTKDGKLPTAPAVGYQLRSWKDRICDGLRLEWVSRSNRGALWRVTLVDGHPAGESDDGVDSDDVSTDLNSVSATGDPSSPTDRNLNQRNDRHDQHHRHSTNPNGPSGGEA